MSHKDKIKVIIEENVPFMETLNGVVSVERLPYSRINRESVRDADALVVRTRNRCDSSLLDGTSVKLVVTATIGTDHIDATWCATNGVKVVNAPGSNAPGVAQYVLSSLMRVVNRPLQSYRIGIVGVGHVGAIIERWARAMNMGVLLCDPPRQEAEGGGQWLTLSDVAQNADIITFHTPLTKTGSFPTYHLADEVFFNRLRRAPIIVNSARGAVVDNKVWVKALETGMCGPAIIDCWENEPNLNPRLLELATIATPHIAGYSIEGKQRASQVALDAICDFFNLPKLKITGTEPAQCAEEITPNEALRSYNPMEDSARLKASLECFEALRNTYPLRREPNVAWNK